MSELFRFEDKCCENCGADIGDRSALLLETGYDESPYLPDASYVKSFWMLCWSCLCRWLIEDCRESIYCGRSERAN